MNFDKATDYLMQAAERAMQESVVDKASKHYEQVLDLLDDSKIDQRVQVLNMLSRAYEMAGDEEKQAIVLQTIEELETDHDEAEIIDDDDDSDE